MIYRDPHFTVRKSSRSILDSDSSVQDSSWSLPDLESLPGRSLGFQVISVCRIVLRIVARFQHTASSIPIAIGWNNYFCAHSNHAVSLPLKAKRLPSTLKCMFHGSAILARV